MIYGLDETWLSGLDTKLEREGLDTCREEC